MWRFLSVIAALALIADVVYAEDNQATMARWYGGALTSGGSVEKVEAWSGHVRAVTADGVREAARKWLDKRRSVTGYLVKALPAGPENRS